MVTICGCSLIAGAGCVHLNDYSTFENKPVANQLEIEAFVNDSHDFEVLSLLLVMTRSKNEPPYSLTVVAHDESPECSEFVMEACEIAYANGASSLLADAPAAVAFVREGNRWTATYRFADCVDRTEGFSMRLRGYRRFSDNRCEPFDQEFIFDHRRVKGVLPSVVVLSGV